MRYRSFFVVAIILAASGVTDIAAAQPVAPLTIYRVVLQPEAGVLTISGTGLGSDLVVSVDGHPVSVLPGASDTQVDVMAPATVLTVAGTYRLTVVDPTRQVGDAFVVASPIAGSVVAAGGTSAGSNGESATAATPPASTAGASAVTRIAGRPNPAAVSPNLVEGFLNTAVGQFALESNTTGIANTASGFAALSSNTTGSVNTANGERALFLNTAGWYNTASGVAALYSNTTGSYNTASGFQAMESNTTGHDNTASGYQALYLNSTGFYNTAGGYKALNLNTTGDRNTASGAAALYTNSTGAFNTATGVGALYENTTGTYNTASGGEALFANTTGQFNSANGYLALSSNTTGLYNTATGVQALRSNGTGSSNTATGTTALYQSTGHNNTAVGNGAGFNATTGSYNLYLGASVWGTAADTNTIRIGLPYLGGTGQNKTFIAGIHGTQLTGSAVQVFVDTNGQLGTVTAGVQSGMVSVPMSSVQQQILEQQATIADLRARLARLETLVTAGARLK
jgi:hypothetical protein